MEGNIAAEGAGHDRHEASRTPAADGIGLVGHVEVALSAQVGTATMSIERLFALKKGDVIGMNEALDAPLTLMLNGKAVARGELLAVDDHFGVRIVELV